jgi:hypothetical protein
MEDVKLLKNRSKMLDTVASRYAELCEANYLIRQLTPYLKKENPNLETLVSWIDILSTGAFHTSLVRETFEKAQRFVNERSVM